jgi:hypothetical protein
MRRSGQRKRRLRASSLKGWRANVCFGSKANTRGTKKSAAITCPLRPERLIAFLENRSVRPTVDQQDRARRSRDAGIRVPLSRCLRPITPWSKDRRGSLAAVLGPVLPIAFDDDRPIIGRVRVHWRLPAPRYFQIGPGGASRSYSPQRAKALRLPPGFDGPRDLLSRNHAIGCEGGSWDGSGHGGEDKQLQRSASGTNRAGNVGYPTEFRRTAQPGSGLLWLAGLPTGLEWQEWVESGHLAYFRNGWKVAVT